MLKEMPITETDAAADNSAVEESALAGDGAAGGEATFDTTDSDEAEATPDAADSGGAEDTPESEGDADAEESERLRALVERCIHAALVEIGFLYEQDGEREDATSFGVTGGANPPPRAETDEFLQGFREI